MKFLLNVGAEKAGTTWLYEYFKKHPEFHDIGKELNLLQRDDFVPDFANYTGYRKDIEKYFSDVAKQNCVSGDFTHYEGSTENIFRLLKGGFKRYDIELVPVYIMRDPINRAWSAWHEYARAAEYHGLQYHDIYNFDMPPPAAFLLHTFLQCRYKETISALDNVFSKPMYFFYEDFFNQESLDIICDRLEIEHAPIDPERVIPGKYTDPAPIEFINMFCYTSKNLAAIEFLKEKFGHVPWDLTRYERV